MRLLKREVDALRRTTNLNEIARDLSRPLPTLEDYAGIKKPLPAPVPERLPEPPAPVEQSADEPEKAADQEPAKPVALDVPEHAEAAPIVRSAP